MLKCSKRECSENILQKKKVQRLPEQRKTKQVLLRNKDRAPYDRKEKRRTFVNLKLATGNNQREKEKNGETFAIKLWVLLA